MDDLPKINARPSPRRPATNKAPDGASWGAIAAIWAAVVVVGMLTYMLMGANAKRRAQELSNKLESPIVSIEADVLYAAYQQNSVKADGAFKGQPVEVTGPVTSIGTDLGENAYIGIGKGLVGAVRCSFPKSRTREVAELSKGQLVTVRGIIKGKSLAQQVELTDCRIVPANRR